MNKSSGRQPAVGEANVLAQKNEFVVRGERQNQERRASARRGVSDVLARENEFLVRGERQNQERRASARRGFAKPRLQRRPCIAGRARFDRGPGSHELQSRIAIDQRQSSVNRSGGR
jgi:hypothetical protein